MNNNKYADYIYGLRDAKQMVIAESMDAEPSFPRLLLALDALMREQAELGEREAMEGV